MFKDLSIKNKLYLGFGSIVAIILILLGVAYNSFSRLSEANAWDRHTMDVLVEIDKIHNSILQIQVEVRGFILTGNEASLNPETDEMAVLSQHTQKAISMTVDNKVQSERFRKIDQLTSDLGQGVDQSADRKAPRAGQCARAPRKRWRAPCRLPATRPSRRPTSCSTKSLPKKAACWPNARPPRRNCRKPCC